MSSGQFFSSSSGLGKCTVVIVAKKHHLCYMFYAFACAHLSVVSEIAQPMASKGQARTSHFSPYGYGPLAF
jgi:hypothetical protein